MKRIFIIFAVLTSWLFCSCSSNGTVNTVQDAIPNHPQNLIVDKRIITDEVFAGRLLLKEVSEGKTNDSYRKVQLSFKNVTSENLTFAYRFDWFGENGLKVDNTGNEFWKTVYVLAGDDVELQSLSPKIGSRDFKLRIKSVE